MKKFSRIFRVDPGWNLGAGGVMGKSNVPVFNCSVEYSGARSHVCLRWGGTGGKVCNRFVTAKDFRVFSIENGVERVDI